MISISEPNQANGICCCWKSWMGSDYNGEQFHIQWTPLKKATYSISPWVPKKGNKVICEEKITFTSSLHPRLSYPWISIQSYQISQYFDTSKTITVLFIQNTQYNYALNPCMIYSHRNHNDLGTILPYLIDVATYWKANIISYDYSGFGCSLGQMNWKNACIDLDRVINFAVNSWNISMTNIILFGEGIGALPSLHCTINTLIHTNTVKGLILWSPEIQYNWKSNDILDLKDDAQHCYCINKIQQIDCPVFIVHGKKDVEVDINASYEMCKNIKYVNNWFPSKGDHYNIPTWYRRKLYTHLDTFISYIKGELTKMNINNTVNTGINGSKSSIVEILPINGVENITKLKTIKNYVKIDNNSNTNGKPSIDIYTNEEALKQSWKYSGDKNFFSIKGKNILQKQSASYNDDNIFELRNSTD